MYCKNCGYALPEGSIFCQNCGARIGTEGDAAPNAPVQTGAGEQVYQDAAAQQTPYQSPYAGTERRVSSTPYLVWAIIVTLLCFWPTGIPAIVYAAKINRCYEEGTPALAEDAARKSKIWSIVTAVVGFVVGVLGAVLIYFTYLATA